MYDLQTIRNWRTTRVITANDTFITDFKPGNFVAAKAIGINASAVMLQGWGKNAALETVTMRVSGWMDQGRSVGGGPGTVLWRGLLTLGTNNIAAAPLDDKGKWDSAGDWFEVQTFDSTVTSGNNLASATVLSETTPQSSLLILPTLGYMNLMFEFTGVAGVAEIGILLREISMDGVV